MCFHTTDWIGPLSGSTSAISLKPVWKWIDAFPSLHCGMFRSFMCSSCCLKSQWVIIAKPKPRCDPLLLTQSELLSFDYTHFLYPSQLKKKNLVATLENTNLSWAAMSSCIKANDKWIGKKEAKGMFLENVANWKKSRHKKWTRVGPLEKIKREVCRKWF